MTYKQLKHLKPSAFKRRCGVRPEIFAQRAEVLHPYLDRSGKRGGQCKLSVKTNFFWCLNTGGNIARNFILLPLGDFLSQPSVG